MQMLAIYVNEKSYELEIKFFFFANILLSLNPYRTQEKSCCKPIFFKIPIFQKRQLIIETHKFKRSHYLGQKSPCCTYPKV